MLQFNLSIDLSNFNIKAQLIDDIGAADLTEFIFGLHSFVRCQYKQNWSLHTFE